MKHLDPYINRPCEYNHLIEYFRNKIRPKWPAWEKRLNELYEDYVPSYTMAAIIVVPLILFLYLWCM